MSSRLGIELEDAKLDEIAEKKAYEEAVEEIDETLDATVDTENFSLVRVAFPSENLGARSINRARILQIRELAEKYEGQDLDRKLNAFEIIMLDEILSTKSDKIQSNLMNHEEYKLIKRMRSAMDTYLNKCHPFSLGDFYMYIVSPGQVEYLSGDVPETVQQAYRDTEPKDYADLAEKIRFTSVRQCNLVMKLIGLNVLSRYGKKYQGRNVKPYTERIRARFFEVPQNGQSLQQNNRFRQQLYLSMQSHLLASLLKRIANRKGDLTEKNISALNRLLAKQEKMNLLRVPEITKKIKYLRAKLKAGTSYNELQEFVDKQLSKLDDLRSGLELD